MVFMVLQGALQNTLYVQKKKKMNKRER